MTELNLVEIKNQINTQIGDKETFNALAENTFKGLALVNVKKALMEGMMRGFTFKDFLEKNVYAIPYGNGYSLVNSIDYTRKIGMKSGVVGNSAPQFEEKDGKIISCSITIKRKVGEHIGDYIATVYWDEYNTGRNLWKSKPRTMLAKVAEMHALRMACPEELSQTYIEEEREKEVKQAPVIDLTKLEVKLKAVKSLEELKVVWPGLPIEAKTKLLAIKEELKEKYENS